MPRPISLFAVLSLSTSLTACAADGGVAGAHHAGGAGKADDVVSDWSGFDDVGEFDSFLSCWDHTFAYNTLTLIERGDELEIRLSGAQTAIAGATTGEAWEPLAARFTVPASECARSEADPRLVRCGAAPLDVTLFRLFVDEEPFAATLGFLVLETTEVTRTDVEGLTSKHIELAVDSGTDDARERYLVAFPFSDACASDPADAIM